MYAQSRTEDSGHELMCLGILYYMIILELVFNPSPNDFFSLSWKNQTTYIIEIKVD